MPLVDPITSAYRPGARALNYRSEPFLNRLALQTSVQGRPDVPPSYSSYAFGDPATPLVTCGADPRRQPAPAAPVCRLVVRRAGSGGRPGTRRDAGRPRGAGGRRGVGRAPAAYPPGARRQPTLTLPSMSVWKRQR